MAVRGGARTPAPRPPAVAWESRWHLPEPVPPLPSTPAPALGGYALMQVEFLEQSSVHSKLGLSPKHAMCVSCPSPQGSSLGSLTPSHHPGLLSKATPQRGLPGPGR